MAVVSVYTIHLTPFFFFFPFLFLIESYVDFLFSTLFRLIIRTVLSHHLPYRACATESQSHAQHTLALAVSLCACHLGLKHREAPLLSLSVILPITYVGAVRVGGSKC